MPAIGELCAAQAGEQYVYIMAAGDFVKVGRARNITQRISQIQCGCPLEIVPVVMFGSFREKDAGSIERDLHQRMASHKSYGEWFLCDPENAVALLVIRSVSFPGTRHFVFDNKYEEMVLARIAAEAICRDKRHPKHCDAIAEVDRLVSIFRAGKVPKVRRKLRPQGSVTPRCPDEHLLLYSSGESVK